MRSLFESGFNVGFQNNFRGAMGQDAAKPAEEKPKETDWGKLIAEGITAGAGAITAYEKTRAAQIAKETEEIRKRPRPGAPGYPGGAPAPGMSPVLIAGMIGIGVIALGAFILVATKG